ncbi:MAG: hypothetical protein ACT4P4_09390 [Betaproteobacteria bacterium]
MLRRHLPIPDSEIVVVNTLVTVREPVSAFATFSGFARQRVP